MDASPLKDARRRAHDPDCVSLTVMECGAAPITRRAPTRPSRESAGGEAADLAAQLPAELKPHLASADENAQGFGAEEFVRRVAERAGTDADGARAGVRAVFTTVREAVTSAEIDDITAQLPKDFGELVGA